MPEITNPSNTFSKIRDVLEVAYLDTPRDVKWSDQLNILTSSSARKRDKCIAMLKIVRSLSPRPVTDVIEESMKYRPNLLPFPMSDYAFKGKVGSGGVNNVFLLESKTPDKHSWVIKVPIHGNKKEPLEMASKDRSEYLEIKQYFASIPDLIQDEHGIVIHGPRDGKPTQAVLQKYHCNDFKDIFRSIDKDSLSQLINSDVVFAEQLMKFVDIIENHPELYERQLDVEGMNNLCVVNTQLGPRLLLLDPHYRSSAKIEPEKKKVIEDRIAYLKSFLTIT